jgi:hypothetical protein
MRHAAVASRGDVDLARIGFGIGDEFRDGSSRHCGMDDHDLGHAHNTGHRRDVANEIEVELFVQRCVDRSRRGDRKERVAIRSSSYDIFGGKITRRARPILDDKLLTKPLR